MIEANIFLDDQLYGQEDLMLDSFGVSVNKVCSHTQGSCHDHEFNHAKECGGAAASIVH